ncbi:uncharacterized protein LOC106091755 [Stomoxys calcitrans]|uniref:uncharacterized protein LOC106091755 n=1 Tax=Stomoxys calcitrans TaxID=35570 RepID=UPI0027E2C7E0|nr:uncharacterized protein LOC106091755 [Stomoxys calcitrans]
MSFKIVAIIVVLIGFNQFGMANRHYNIELHNLSCAKSEARLKEFNCSFQQTAPNRYNVSVSFLLYRQLSSKAEARLLIHIKSKKSMKALKFFDAKLNLCDLLHKQIPFPLVRDIFLEASRSINAPMACPVRTDFLYNISNFRLSENFYPTYTILVEYNVSLIFYEDNVSFASFRLQGATTAKNS